MIEETVLNHLCEELDVPCSLEVPENPPDAFVVIEKTGGSLKEHLFSAMFTIQSYGATLYEAAMLNEAAEIAMLNMDELDGICKVSLNSAYNFTDTETKRYRYQAVFNLVYY